MPGQHDQQPSQNLRLRVEQLEDRRLLAVLTVQNDLDDTLGNLAGDGELSLREAIEIANNPGTAIDGFVSNDVDDTIEFARPFFDEIRTIALADGELEITETLTIDGPGQELLAIDAQHNSRVLNYSSASGNLWISDITLKNGRTTGDNESNGNSGFTTTFNGAGVRFASSAELHIYDSTITANSTEGFVASGAGVAAEAGNVVVFRSTISGNQVYGSVAVGGGIFSLMGNLSLFDSMVSGNKSFSYGGGIFVGSGDASIYNSTISHNATTVTGHGGGIFGSLGELSIDHSSVISNSAASKGGGIAAVNKFGIPSIEVHNSIVAGNSAMEDGPDILEVFGTEITMDYSLVGILEFPERITGNLDNITGTALSPLDPLLGPLADNGGATKTHALLPGSPALDAGDPSIVFDPDEFDQRGAPYGRVATGILSGIPGQRIDIGAYEAQSPPSADFVDDDHINGQDFLAWQIGFGMTENATRADGDSDGDGDVDLSDLAAWRVSYGQAEMPPPPVAALSAVSEEWSARLADAVLGIELGDGQEDYEAILSELSFMDDGELVRKLEPNIIDAPHSEVAESQPVQADSTVRKENERLVDELLKTVFE